MKRDIYYITGILILVIILLLQKCQGNKELEDQITLTNNLSDTIKIRTNKLGQEQAKISVLQTNKVFEIRLLFTYREKLKSINLN